MEKLLIATNNRGKQKELLALLSGLEAELVTPQETGLRMKPPETGRTYAQNAQIKAEAFCQESGLPSLADDTGLEVAALGGAPGLRSARFSPDPNANDADRRKLLLSKLEEVPRPWSARFVCCVALALPNGETCFFEGSCKGIITSEERGERGFGYDRIFLFPEFGKTMAELRLAEKNLVSHRANAVRGILPKIKELLEN